MVNDRQTLATANGCRLSLGILSDCANGFIWAKLDMTDSFYQTPVHRDNIKYTAVTTPFGLYKWRI